MDFRYLRGGVIFNAAVSRYSRKTGLPLRTPHVNILLILQNSGKRGHSLSASELLNNLRAVGRSCGRSLFGWTVSIPRFFRTRWIRNRENKEIPYHGLRGRFFNTNGKGNKATAVGRDLRTGRLRHNEKNVKQDFCFRIRHSLILRLQLLHNFFQAIKSLTRSLNAM